MTKNLFTNVIVVAACFLFQGCYYFQDPRQKNWHDEILRASLAVNRATVKKSAFIVDKQLVDFIGEPDFKLSPFELQELLIEDEPYRTKVMDHVRYSYCLAKRDVALREAAGSHYAPGTNNWKECAEFNKCSLWLYDETKHFGKPMVWGWGYKEGFVCQIFFVEGSNVIGDSSVIFWKPLRSLPQQ